MYMMRREYAPAASGVEPGLEKQTGMELEPNKVRYCTVGNGPGSHSNFLNLIPGN